MKKTTTCILLNLLSTKTGKTNRMTLGLSHYDFAKKLGVAPSTIISWENDRVKNVEKKIRPYLDGLVEFDDNV